MSGLYRSIAFRSTSAIFCEALTPVVKIKSKDICLIAFKLRIVSHLSPFNTHRITSEFCLPGLWGEVDDRHRDIIQAQQLACVQHFGNVKDLGLLCRGET